MQGHTALHRQHLRKAIQKHTDCRVGENNACQSQMKIENLTGNAPEGAAGAAELKRKNKRRAACMPVGDEVVCSTQ